MVATATVSLRHGTDRPQLVPTNVEPRESGELHGIQYSIYSAPDRADVDASLNSKQSGEPPQSATGSTSHFDNEKSTGGPR